MFLTRNLLLWAIIACLIYATWRQAVSHPEMAPDERASLAAKMALGFAVGYTLTDVVTGG